MSLTYEQLVHKVNEIWVKNGFDHLDDDFALELRDYILKNIEQILKGSALFQVYGENLNPDVDYMINEKDPLTKETISAIYSQIDEMIEHNTIMELLKEVLNKDEEIMINDIIDAYNSMEDDEFLAYVNSADIKWLLNTTSPILGIIALIKEWTHIIDAIKEVLEEYNLSPKNPENRAKIRQPEEIKSFLDDINQILLSHITESSNFFHIQNIPQTLN